MTTYKEEVSRIVLSNLLDKYPAGAAIGEKEWNVAYKLFHTNQTIDTLQWKLDNIMVDA